MSHAHTESTTPFDPTRLKARFGWDFTWLSCNYRDLKPDIHTDINTGSKDPTVVWYELTQQKPNASINLVGLEVIIHSNT